MVWRVIILVVLGVLNLAVGAHLIWGSTGLLKYWAVKEEYASLQQRLAELDQQNLTLSREIRLLQSDNQYFEKMIRLRLHFVRPNEVLYVFDKSSASKPGALP